MQPEGGAIHPEDQESAVRGSYVARRDRKTYVYAATWKRTARSLSWSATVERRDEQGSIIARPSGAFEVLIGATSAELEQRVRNAAHEAIEKEEGRPSGRLAVLRAALRRLSAPNAGGARDS
jgi:hypothetical protein